VVRFPLPIIEPPTDPDASRARLGLPGERFVFLFSFDFLSVAERKNPFGVVEAFREAFTVDEGPVLVIKSINGDRRPDDLDRLRYAARGRPDVMLRDGYLDAPSNAALLEHADCFVSLHRSEGFGFNLADAMALGTPVIATRYSGNLTFMHDDDCYLVGYDEIAVGDGHFPYHPHSRWADPRLDEAVAFMREVVEHPAQARARAERARTRVLGDFGPPGTGLFVRNRLAGVRACREAEAPTIASGPTRRGGSASTRRFRRAR
jgi:glycosyltransferase involved in cell wall biosynthesis